MGITGINDYSDWVFSGGNGGEKQKIARGKKRG